MFTQDKVNKWIRATEIILLQSVGRNWAAPIMFALRGVMGVLGFMAFCIQLLGLLFLAGSPVTIVGQLLGITHPHIVSFIVGSMFIGIFTVPLVGFFLGRWENYRDDFNARYPEQKKDKDV